jgi:transcriptional regulator with XRE-family HTH domain
MTFGEHISTLRKRKGLSQSDFGKAVGTSGDIIGKYERDEVKPSIEVASKIADALEVTLDFLVDDSAVASFDKQTVKRLKDIEHLSDDDRKTLFSMMDAFLRDAKARKAYAS